MHTDEYEISIGREIALCRKMIKKLQNSLAKREKQHGMTTAAFLRNLEAGPLPTELPFESWRREYQDLRHWRRSLQEYEEALENLKRL